MRRGAIHVQKIILKAMGSGSRDHDFCFRGLAQQALFDSEQSRTKTHVIGMWVSETLVGSIQLLQIFQGVFPDRMDRRTLVNQLALLKYGDHELLFLEAHGIGLENMMKHGVVRPKGTPRGNSLFIQEQHIPSHPSPLIVHSYHLLGTGVGDFFGVVRSLDLGCHMLPAIIHGCKLIDPPQGRARE